MIVKCATCQARFDDEFRTTTCPHRAFHANNGDNTFTTHEDSFLEEAPSDRQRTDHS